MKKKSLSVFIIILLIVIIMLLVALLIPQNEDDTGKGVVFEPNNSSQTQGMSAQTSLVSQFLGGAQSNYPQV